jgi:selenocysteine lyase/cysteine desulfurase
LRFEYGTRTYAIGAGLGASLDWLAALGWTNVEQHIAGLSAYLKECIQARPHLQLLTPLSFAQSSGLTTFIVAGQDAGALLAKLGQQWHIYVRYIPHYNAIRISTAHFNSQADIDRLMEAVDEMR